MNCPECQSADCKKVSMVYQAGTSTGTIFGVGSSLDGEVGIGSGVTSKQSLLAQRLAPPEPKSAAVALVVLLFSVILIVIAISGYFLSMPIPIAGVLAGVGVMGILWGILLNRNVQEENKDFLYLQKMWEASWVCLSCGHSWNPVKNTNGKIEFNCPSCKQRLQAEASSLGQLVDCPFCSQPV